MSRSLRHITESASHYQTRKAIEDGMKLYCIWSKTDPYRVDDKTGFVINSTRDMRKMGMDLMRMADGIEELDKIWDDDE